MKITPETQNINLCHLHEITQEGTFGVEAATLGVSPRRFRDDIAERPAAMVSDAGHNMATAERMHHSLNLAQRPILRDPIGRACPDGHPLLAQGVAELAYVAPEMLTGLDPQAQISCGTGLL